MNKLNDIDSKGSVIRKIETGNKSGAFWEIFHNKIVMSNIQIPLTH